MFFWREIQIPIQIIFDAKNFKNIKDDYGEKFDPISQQWSFLVQHFIGRQYVPTFLSAL
jgi:hypothetical protein